MNHDIPLSQLRDLYATAQRADNVDMSYFNGERGAVGSTVSPELSRWQIVEVGEPGSGSLGGEPSYWYSWYPLTTTPLYDLNATDFPYNTDVADLFDYVESGLESARNVLPLIEINGLTTVAAGTRVLAFYADGYDALLFVSPSNGAGNDVAIATWDGATTTEIEPAVTQIQVDETSALTADSISSGVVRLSLDHTATTETYDDATINYDGDSVVNFNNDAVVNLDDDVVVNIGGNVDINIGGNTTIDTDVNVAVNLGGPLTINGPVFFPSATLVNWTANQTNLVLGANNVRLRITSDTHYRRLNSLVGVAGQTVYLHNVGSYVILLTHEDAGSVAANRIATTTANDFWLAPTHCVALTYDGTDSRWRVSESSEERLGGIFTHADWSTSQADFDPDREGQQQRVNPTVDEIALTGVAGGIAGLRYHFLNVNSSNSFYLRHEDVTSTAANRFTLPGGEDVLIPPRTAFEIEYDGTSSRWRLLHIPAPTPALLETYIGYGDADDKLTGSADLIREAAGQIRLTRVDATGAPTITMQRRGAADADNMNLDEIALILAAARVDGVDTLQGYLRCIYTGDGTVSGGEISLFTVDDTDTANNVFLADSDGEFYFGQASTANRLLGNGASSEVVTISLGSGLSLVANTLSATTPSMSLDDLTDVTILTPSFPNYIGWDGAHWVNMGIALDNLSNVVCPTPSTNDVLTFNGTNWVNAAPGSGYTDEEARDAIGAALVEGAGIDITVNDGADTITIASTITQYTDEMARDAIGAALTAGTGISVTVNDGADTITVASTITQYTDENARDAIGTALVAGTGISVTVDDGADTITVANTNAPPTGGIMMYGGGSAPSGWLECDGSAVSRTTYSALFTAISTTFGTGDGSTTFNLPDFRGRAPIGSGTGSGLTARTRGATGGNETHTLVTSEIPAHNHPVNSAASVTAGGAYTTGGGTANGIAVTTSNTGGGGSHNNMQPWLAVTFIIKT